MLIDSPTNFQSLLSISSIIWLNTITQLLLLISDIVGFALLLENHIIKYIQIQRRLQLAYILLSSLLRISTDVYR